MENEDRRVRKTKKAIKDAFWHLAETKPMEEITVKEICELADINRSSFYFHYMDLPALIEELSREAAERAFEQFSVMYMRSDYPIVMVDQFIELIRSDPHVKALLINDKYNKFGATHFAKLLKKKVIPYWLSHSEMSWKQADYLFDYMTAGCGEMLKKWSRGEPPVSEELLKSMMSNMMIHGLYFYMTPEV